MSRSFWEEEVQGGDQPDSYRQGSTINDPAAVEEVLRRFFLYDPDYESMRRFFVGKDISEHLRQPDMDGQGFLDALIRNLENEDRTSHFKYVDYLVSDVINSLKNGGQREFRVDYRVCVDRIPLSERYPGVIIGARVGTSDADDPLTIQYLLPDTKDAHAHGSVRPGPHVNVHIRGISASVGSQSRNCAYSVEKAPQWLAWHAKDCTFYLCASTMEKVDANQSIHVRDAKNNIADAKIITFSVRNGDEETEMSMRSDFLEHGNHLYIPDGEGNWKEVFLQ